MAADIEKVMNREFFKGKKVLVMGLGRFGGGVDVAKFAGANGAKVIVTDMASAEKLRDSVGQLSEFSDIDFHLGRHDPTDFEQADVIVANPAVAPDNEFLQTARRAGRLIASQIGIFFELCAAPIVGITGANGKSTTAALTAHILRNATSDILHPTYDRVFLSGNIGNRPLLAEIDEITCNDLVVLELSSFQLEQLAETKKAPKVALLTNLTPNHLDRHGTFAEYCSAKENIFKFQELDEDCPSVSFFNAEDEIGAEWFERYRCDVGRSCIKFSSDDVPAQMREIYPLPGRANLSNLAAALAIARCFDVSDEAVERCLGSFKSLPHRLELVANVNGVRWYNDSIATTPQSSIAALDAFDCSPVIIAGGYDKNLGFDDLGRKIAETAKAAILLGQTAPKIAKAIRSAQLSLRGAKRHGNLKRSDTMVEIVASLSDAVNLASRLAVSGDVVLLSPACASYDMFDNFQQRGQQFVELVGNLSRP